MEGEEGLIDECGNKMYESQQHFDYRVWTGNLLASGHKLPPPSLPPLPPLYLLDLFIHLLPPRCGYPHLPLPTFPAAALSGLMNDSAGVCGCCWWLCVCGNGGRVPSCRLPATVLTHRAVLAGSGRQRLIGLTVRKTSWMVPVRDRMQL